MKKATQGIDSRRRNSIANRRYYDRDSQQGVVLIVALLVVSLVAGVAVTFSEDFQIQAARSENRWHGAQAHAYLLGTENLARAVLKDDIQSGAVDHLGEDWAQVLDPFSIDGGSLMAHIEDAQSRFNINSLVDKPSTRNIDNLPAHDPRRFTSQQRQFIRLLQTFEEIPMTTDRAIEVTESVIDWLDADSETTGFSGAEEDYYLNLESPYRPANRLLVDLSELRLVKNINKELYSKLLPFVVALPKEQRLNVNTATITLLRTLQTHNDLSPLSLTDAEDLYRAREGRYYDTVKAFLSSEGVRDLNAVNGNLESEVLTVTSNYFLVFSKVKMVRQKRYLLSMLARKGESVLPVMRRDYW